MSKTEEQGALFEERFLEQHVGTRLLSDQRVATAELVANAWDAGATRVEITWPQSRDSNDPVKVSDNGSGMTPEHLESRWRRLSYDRVKHQGEHAEFPPGVSLPRRPVFGRNGVGRFAGFCFGESYSVITRRGAVESEYLITRGHGHDQPFSVKKLGERKKEGHGTTIVSEAPISQYLISAEELRSELSLRFLVDPGFVVKVNGRRVDFADIPSYHVKQEQIDVDNVGTLRVTVIDLHETDRTSRNHGIAWHVNGRLVGECSWRDFTDQSFIDGRKSAAKRYTFLVEANELGQAVTKDWSGFRPHDEHFIASNDDVTKWVREFLLDASKEERAKVYQSVEDANSERLRQIGPLGREMWRNFVRQTQETCPSIGEKELKELGALLATLERSSSRYGLITCLSELDFSRLDVLQKLLSDWTVDMAKIVLDELKSRLLLVDELARRTNDPTLDEVHDLQPLFERGLWIFGPEYETIEYTSNKGMTKVIHELYGSPQKGSRLRPDFAILPDSSAGFYSYPEYDEHGAEVGTDRLTIVELKLAGVTISTKEKNQCWNYVLELYRKGLLTERSRVTCFALGSKVDLAENSPREEKERRVIIRPMHYEFVLERAKSRLLKLFDRVRDAPFFQGDNSSEEFLSERGQLSLGLSHHPMQ